MKISDVVLEMELGGVDAENITAIVELCKSKGVNFEMIDDELVKRGFEKIFTVDYDAYDEYGGWADEDYASIEKFPYKQYYKE